MSTPCPRWCWLCPCGCRASWVPAWLWRSRSSTGRSTLRSAGIRPPGSSRWDPTSAVSQRFTFNSLTAMLFLRHQVCLEILFHQSNQGRPHCHVEILWNHHLFALLQVSNTQWDLLFIVCFIYRHEWHQFSIVLNLYCHAAYGSCSCFTCLPRTQIVSRAHLYPGGNQNVDWWATFLVNRWTSKISPQTNNKSVFNLSGELVSVSSNNQCSWLYYIFCLWDIRDE